MVWWMELRRVMFRSFSRRKNEETKGVLSYRIADRRGHHSDHCGHRYSEFAQGQDGGERILGGCRDSQYQHSSSQLLDSLSSNRLLRDVGCARWPSCGLRSAYPQYRRASLPYWPTSL